MNENKNQQAYWKKNIQYMLILLAIWFFASFGLGILLAEKVNTIKMGGFKMGFWFAQQGSIYIFLIIIWVYVWLMNRLDKEFNLDEE